MHYQFQMTYEKIFNTALNQKRSSCEQSGLKITRKAIAHFKERREDFFSFEELCKLRRATTDRERKAFFWFYDSFFDEHQKHKCFITLRQDFVASEGPLWSYGHLMVHF